MGNTKSKNNYVNDPYSPNYLYPPIDVRVDDINIYNKSPEKTEEEKKDLNFYNLMNQLKLRLKNGEKQVIEEELNKITEKLLKKRMFNELLLECVSPSRLYEKEAEIENIKFLINLNADVNRVNLAHHIIVSNFTNIKESLSFLIDSKIDLNLKYGKNENCIFHLFPRNLNKSEELVDRILLNSNLNLKNKQNQIFLHSLAQSTAANSDFLIEKYFVSPYMEEVDSFGNTPIFYLCQNGCIKKVIFERLIDQVENISLQNKNGFNLLHLSCLFLNLSLMEILLLKKIDVNAQNENGKTPLHILCENSLVKSNYIKVLIIFFCYF